MSAVSALTLYTATAAIMLCGVVEANIVNTGGDFTCDGSAVVDWAQQVHGMIVDASQCSIKSSKLDCTVTCVESHSGNGAGARRGVFLCRNGAWRLFGRQSATCEATSLEYDADCGDVSLASYAATTFNMDLTGCTEGRNKGYKCTASCADGSESQNPNVDDPSEVKFVCKGGEWKAWPRLKCRATGDTASTTTAAAETTTTAAAETTTTAAAASTTTASATPSSPCVDCPTCEEANCDLNTKVVCATDSQCVLARFESDCPVDSTVCAYKSYCTECTCSELPCTEEYPVACFLTELGCQAAPSETVCVDVASAISCQVKSFTATCDSCDCEIAGCGNGNVVACATSPGCSAVASEADCVSSLSGEVCDTVSYCQHCDCGVAGCSGPNTFACGSASGCTAEASEADCIGAQGEICEKIFAV